MRCYLLRSHGRLSLEPSLLKKWVETVEQHAQGMHLDAGRYFMSSPDDQGFYILAAEGDLMTQQVEEYLRHMPVRYAVASGTTNPRPTYDDLGNTWVWQAIVRQLFELYNG